MVYHPAAGAVAVAFPSGLTYISIMTIQEYANECIPVTYHRNDFIRHFVRRDVRLESRPPLVWSRQLEAFLSKQYTMLTPALSDIAGGLRGVSPLPTHDNHLGFEDHVAGRPGFATGEVI